MQNQEPVTLRLIADDITLFKAIQCRLTDIERDVAKRFRDRLGAPYNSYVVSAIHILEETQKEFGLNYIRSLVLNNLRAVFSDMSATSQASLQSMASTGGHSDCSFKVGHAIVGIYSDIAVLFYDVLSGKPPLVEGIQTVYKRALEDVYPTGLAGMSGATRLRKLLSAFSSTALWLGAQAGVRLLHEKSQAPSYRELLKAKDYDAVVARLNKGDYPKDLEILDLSDTTLKGLQLVTHVRTVNPSKGNGKAPLLKVKVDRAWIYDLKDKLRIDGAKSFRIIDSECTLETQGPLEDCAFSNCRIRDSNIRGSATNCTFENVTFKDTELCLELNSCSFQRCTFDNCTIISLNTLKSPGVLLGNTFINCLPPSLEVLDKASESYLRMSGLTFFDNVERW